jgi:uncharacterized protein with HEPN domain
VIDETSPDLTFLWDMREAGLGLIRLTRLVSYEEFSTDLELIDAVERGLAIIGQAARLVSVETRDARPDVPWRDFIGMARLIRDADDALEPEELWLAVRGVTAMVSSVSRLMPAEDDASV